MQDGREYEKSRRSAICSRARDARTENDGARACNSRACTHLAGIEVVQPTVRLRARGCN